jgi:hypothetical protein
LEKQFFKTFSAEKLKFFPTFFAVELSLEQGDVVGVELAVAEAALEALLVEPLAAYVRPVLNI